MESTAGQRDNEPLVFEETVEDRALVSAILAGDRKATAEFVARYSDRIFGYVWQRMLPRTDLVEDVVQDILLTAWRSLPQYKGEANLESWLLGIARHRVEEHYRKRLREAHEQLEVDELPTAIAGFEPPWDKELDEQRVRERTQRILAILPETYSIALQWRYWEKCSTREMAVFTGKTEKSMERLLARAREAFRKRWDQ